MDVSFPEERMRILLVDDSEQNLLALEAALGVLGQELVLAHSGAEALRCLLHFDFAAILLDVKMPAMDGFETAELIRARPRSRHTPIIFLTAFRGEEQLARGYHLGAVDFLFKPVIPEILRSKVSAFVELNRISAMLRKQTQVLQDAEQRFRVLLEAAPDPMIVSTEAGHIQLVNARTEAMFGWRRNELANRSILTLLPGWPSLDARAAEDLAGHAPRSIELQAHRKSGAPFSVELSLCPIRTKEGPVIISAIRDITERKEWERRIRGLNAALEARVAERTAELSRSNEALRLSNEDLNHFAYAASHDLREPLRMISIYCDMLGQQEVDPPRQAEYLGVIREGARRMDGLLTGLLEYTKVVSSDEPAEEVDCASAMEDVVLNLQAMIAETVATVSWEPLPVLRAGRIHIVQLLQNLVANSLKYRRNVAPVVRISSRREEDAILLIVSDNGIGIKSDYLTHVFEPFKRLHNQSSYPGAGIGLALCQRIAERYRGKIWVESVVGEGSSFHVCFPGSMLVETDGTASLATAGQT